MPYVNDAELNAAILNDLKGMVDEISKRLYDNDGNTTNNMSLLDNMQDIVYNAGTPQFYQRQPFKDSLMGSFDVASAMVIGQEVIGEIFHDYARMSNDPDTFVHGSHYFKTDDIRSGLIDIVINGTSGPLFGENPTSFWRQPRDFWKPLEDYVSSGKADKLIEDAFNKRGIIWKKV